MDRIYATNKKEWENIIKKDYLDTRELSVSILKDGIMLPPRVKKKTNLEYEGGVCDKNFNFITGLKRHEPQKRLAIEVNSSYRTDKVQKNNQKVIFGGCIAGRFGHFVTEGLGRLWFVLKDDKYKECKIAFLPYSDGEKAWFKDFFRLLDIEDERILMVKEAMQFSEIIIPEESIHTWYKYTKEFLIPYKTLEKNLPNMISCKLYLTKKSWNHGAQLCNEEYFEEYFRKKGFICIEPEDYTIEEQISLLYHSTEVVTTLGSLSHLALFCRPATKFIILTRVNDDVLIPQALINQATNVDWYIVDVAKNYLYANRAVGVNYIGPTKYFREFVQDYYHEELQGDAENSTEQYIKKWCEYYSTPGNFKKISNLKSIDFLKRLYQISHGNTLDCNKWFDDKEKNKDYTNIYEWQIKEMAKITNCDDENLDLSIEVHLSNVGWILPAEVGVPAGDGQHFIEAIRMTSHSKKGMKITYTTYDQVSGWGKISSIGMMAGSTGKSRYLSGLKIYFHDEEKKNYIKYRCMYANDGWSDWRNDGEEEYRPNDYLMGIQVRIE